MGKPAHDFVDFLAKAGQTIWQILPVGPTGYADSPYQSCSAFAGNPYFIDLDLLAADGLLTKKDYAAINWGGDAARRLVPLPVFEQRLAARLLPVHGHQGGQRHGGLAAVAPRPARA